MAGVFIEEFQHAPGGHCGSTAMRDMLRFYGHEFTEDMMFGLGAGIDFLYYKNEEAFPPVYIGGRTPDLEQNICAHLGIGMELVTGLEPDQAWAAVKAMMDEGIPAMIHADVYYLDYLRAKRHFPAHRIILVGYDTDRQVAFVADNDRDDIQECSLASLAEARSASFLPRPADNAYYSFDVPTTLVPLVKAVPAAVELAARHNLGLDDGRSYFAEVGTEVGLGVAGVEAFAGDMSGWPSYMTPEALEMQCKLVYVSAEKGGTGYGGNFRRMYGRFLLEAASRTGPDDFAPLGKEFIAIGDMWSELSFTFKELSADGTAAVASAHPIADEICSHEREAFAALAAANRGRP